VEATCFAYTPSFLLDKVLRRPRETTRLNGLGANVA
jgi:hypothetical protein